MQKVQRIPLHCKRASDKIHGHLGLRFFLDNRVLKGWAVERRSRETGVVVVVVVVVVSLYLNTISLKAKSLWGRVQNKIKKPNNNVIIS